MSIRNPVSPKVMAATVGASVAAALGSLVVWILGVTVWGAPASAVGVNDAIAAVPTPVASVVTLFMALVGAGVPGWRTTDPLRVTPREADEVRERRSEVSHDSGSAGADQGVH